VTCDAALQGGHMFIKAAKGRPFVAQKNIAVNKAPQLEISLKIRIFYY